MAKKKPEEKEIVSQSETEKIKGVEVEKDQQIAQSENEKSQSQELVSERKTYLDYIRIMAAFFVIAIHVVSFFLNQRKATFGSAAWNIEMIMDNFIRVAVPLFVMISGALFLDERKKVSTKKLLKNNVLRMFVIFVFWAIVYKFGSMFSSGKPITWKGVGNAFLEICKGDFHYHLWYLPMLIGLYLITPLLRKVCKKENKQLVEYFLIVFFIGTTFIRFMASKNLGAPTNAIFDFANQLTPDAFVNYVGVYILGWYLATFDHSKKFRIIIYSVGFGLYFLGAGADLLYSYVRGGTSFFSSDNLGFLKLLPASAIFLAFRYSKFANKEHKFVKYLSGCTFGIYLTHAFVRNILFNLFGEGMMVLCETGWAVLLIPVYTIVIFVVSFGVTALISLLPKKIRKWFL